jgi:hypothetical protein
MVIELQFYSITIQAGEIEETYPLMFSSIQQYLPVQKTPKRRRPRKKKQTVGHLIDALIDSINIDCG